MRKVLLAGIGLLAFTSAYAQQSAKTPNGQPVPLYKSGQSFAVAGGGTLTITTSAQGLSALGSIPSLAQYATFDVSGCNVVYREDGTAPTSTVGNTLAPNNGSPPYVYQGALANVQFIRASGCASATIFVEYWQ